MNMIINTNYIDWDESKIVEVVLISPYAKVWEVLTRIGIPSKNQPQLFQSCHLLFRNGKYYIVHFKELFGLASDGGHVKMTEGDLNRRNTIIQKLEEWRMIGVVDKDQISGTFNNADITIIKMSEKNKWTLIPKYTLSPVQI